jgi:hypothetical protein
VSDERETKATVEFDPQTLLWAEPKPTALIEREQLRELIDASAEPDRPPRAHTIRRELLRAREDALNTDIRPSLSPILVAAVVTLLIIAFIAATHVR